MKQLPDVTFANNSLVIMFQWVGCITPARNTERSRVALSHIRITLVMSWIGLTINSFTILVKKIQSFYILTSSFVKMGAVIGDAKETLITKININNSVFCKELYMCLVVIILWCSPCSCIRMISLTHFTIEKVCMATLRSVCY